MSLHTRLQRIICDLSDLRDDCRYTDERDELSDVIYKLNTILLTSDSIR